MQCACAEMKNDGDLSLDQLIPEALLDSQYSLGNQVDRPAEVTEKLPIDISGHAQEEHNQIEGVHVREHNLYKGMMRSFRENMPQNMRLN